VYGVNFLWQHSVVKYPLLSIYELTVKKIQCLGLLANRW